MTNDPQGSTPTGPPAGPPTGPAVGVVPAALQALLDVASVRLELTALSGAVRADVVLDTPATRNAQTPHTWSALAAAGQWLHEAADVVIVRGTGPSFSAGLDRRAFTPQGLPGQPGLAQLAAMPTDVADETIARYQDGFSIWSEADFVSIAAVQGHAVGAGFQLALACDLRVAADDVQFAMREPALGLVPDLGGTKPLVALVGTARAIEICVTGRPVTASEALALGLVQTVVAADGLADEVDRLVESLTAGDVAAVKATAALLRGAAGRTASEQRAAERAAQLDRLHVLARRMSAQR